MFLRSLHITNFKAAGLASLHFDHTTVIIGENGAGRGSLFEALWVALAPGDSFRFDDEHFHRTAEGATGAIQIALELAESCNGDWNPPDRVAMLFRNRGPRSLRFELIAEPPALAPQPGRSWSTIRNYFVGYEGCARLPGSAQAWSPTNAAPITTPQTRRCARR